MMMIHTRCRNVDAMTAAQRPVNTGKGLTRDMDSFCSYETVVRDHEAVVSRKVHSRCSACTRATEFI